MRVLPLVGTAGAAMAASLVLPASPLALPDRTAGREAPRLSASSPRPSASPSAVGRGGPRARPGRLMARVRPGHSLPFRARPGGHVAGAIAARTEFGSPAALPVARVRGRWLGLISSQRPNGSLAWVKRDHPAIGLRRTRWAIDVDLSRRRLELRRGGRAVARLPVGVGGPASPTPAGRFAVTDELPGARFSSSYGCCILGLSGHQPRTPANWRGGSRLAIHGTSAPATIGAAATAGCLHASDGGMRLLMRRVPLGTPVRVHR